MSKRSRFNDTKGHYHSSSDVISSSSGVRSPSDSVLPDLCVVCRCRLSVKNRSESPNVCRECLHSLEF